MRPVPLHSGEAPDTYFIEGRVVGHGAGRSTPIADFSNRRPCMRFEQRNGQPQRPLNLKQKAPHLSKPLTWIRVCPNKEHHQQALAC